MNLDQITEARNALRSQFASLIEEFNSYGGKSWLVMTVDVHAHRPNRDENGRPLGIFSRDQEWERQDRFVVQSDGFTQVEFEITENRFKVLSNTCLDQRYPEDKAFNHGLFAVGAEVDLDTLRKFHRAYVQLSNARMKFGYELEFDTTSLAIHWNGVLLTEQEMVSGN